MTAEKRPDQSPAPALTVTDTPTRPNEALYGALNAPSDGQHNLQDDTHAKTQEDTTIPYKPLYRVPEAALLLSLSRSVLYELLRSGRLRSVTEGRTRLIPASAIAEYVALLEQEASAPSSLKAVS